MPGGKQMTQIEPAEPLTFTPPTGDKLTLSCRSLTLETGQGAAEQGATASNEMRASCRLIATADAAIYARIDAEACFYILPRLRVPQNPPGFAARSVEIELRLHPDMFDILPIEALSDPYTLWRYLAQQNRAAPEDQLFSTASWLALAVTQTADGHTTGYRTLWNHITPSALEPGSIFSPQALHAILNFLGQREELAPGADCAEEAQTGENATTGVEAELQTALERLATQVETLETELTQMAQGGAQPAEVQTETGIARHFVHYFQEANWDYEVTEEGDTFRLQFQGTTHTWQCLALAREPEAQALFYSVVPQLVPAAQRPALAELLTRANDALVIGNFEMDWDDGEVRFKTSLDARGQQLNPGWLHNLVYANLQTMNTYLPAILVVANGDMSPQAAIESIEG